MILLTELLISPHLRLMFQVAMRLKDQLQVQTCCWESCLLWECWKCNYVLLLL